MNRGSVSGSDTVGTPDVLVDVRDELAVVTLNRPARLNALRGSTLAELDAALTLLERSAPGAVVLLRGAGRAFCSGADIAEIDASDDVGSDEFTRQGQALFDRVEASPLVSVAVVHGYALGGGLELAMACDFRLAARSSALGQPEAALGHLPAWGGTRRLPRLIGRGKALELILTGERLTADQACSLGLVDRVVEDEDLESAAFELAHGFAQRPSTVIRAVKQAVAAGLSGGPAAGHQAERTGMALCRTRPSSLDNRKNFLNSSAN
jgi:enoyl-CoA hydratase